MANPQELESEVLQVADTRPTLLAGIPMELAALCIFGGFAINNQLHSFIIGEAIMLPIWGISAFLVRKDYNYVRICLIWLRGAAMLKDNWRNGGAAVSHFPIHPKGFRGIIE